MGAPKKADWVKCVSTALLYIDLNPDEAIWNYLKRVEQGNVCCSNLDQLSTELICARERVRHKRDIIKACSHQCGYAV